MPRSFPPGAGISKAFGPVVVMVSVVVTTPEFGVTEDGEALQVASSGSPLHEKLIGLVNEPCGVIVSVYDAVWPLSTVAAPGFTDTEKSAALMV